MNTLFRELRPALTLGAIALTLAFGLLFVGPQAAQPVEACRSLRGFAPLDTLLQPDGRINQVAHFGGDSLYCVDENGNPTNEYDSMAAFRLLDIGGQDLWNVSAEDVAASLAALEASGEDQTISTGAGSHGTATLTLLANDGTPSFQLVAYDEFGKLNTLEFQGCRPVGPSAPGTTQSSASAPAEAAPAICYIDLGCGDYSSEPIVSCDIDRDSCYVDVLDENNNNSTTDYICNPK